MKPQKIAIFASGSGSNAQRITEFLREQGIAEVAAVYCNNPGAFVISRAESLSVPVVILNREDFRNGERLLQDLESRKVDWIVLAGFLWLVPSFLVEKFPGRIINIHPALLPKFGGKGMYGEKVHQAVIEAGESHSGISIHVVNEKYDDGQIIFQAECSVSEEDTPESLAAKIHELEYRYFPVVIGDLIEGKIQTGKSFQQ